MRLPAAERELSHSPRIFHGGCAVCLNIGSELLKLWCAILGLNQSTKPMPIGKRPPYTGFASRDAVAKLRLDGTPTPRSWVARMTKRPDTTGAGKSASL